MEATASTPLSSACFANSSEYSKLVEPIWAITSKGLFIEFITYSTTFFLSSIVNAGPKPKVPQINNPLIFFSDRKLIKFLIPPLYIDPSTLNGVIIGQIIPVNFT